ncbi:peptidoglycan editing factor PgeF [Paenalcaligenes sp. Me52]|uniref:peptidoglycan editing factor PgeF n=1 Tax=Paenalcaligenes sp. Me52 TaxID=3392038 RepID=UPI003D2D0577
MEKPLKVSTITGPEWAGCSYFSSLRYPGYSRGDWDGLNLGAHCSDEAADVAANRALLRQSLPSEPVWLQQVHGTGVLDADVYVPSGNEPPQADAAITTQTNKVLAIMTADCLPVVVYDSLGGVLGAAHAGWRGLASGVLERMVDQMRSKTTTQGPLYAWVGPAISQQHFEVGAEVREAFLDNNAHYGMYFVPAVNAGKYFADLPGIARHRLHQHCDGNIAVALSGECSYERTDRYYSYRRQASTGRLVTVAWLQSQA